MLLLPNKKKMATLIVASMGKPKHDYVQNLGEESDTGEYKLPDEETGMEGLEASMDAFIKAVSAKDAKAAVAAMQDFMAQCEGQDHMEPDGDEA